MNEINPIVLISGTSKFVIFGEISRWKRRHTVIRIRKIPLPTNMKILRYFYLFFIFLDLTSCESALAEVPTIRYHVYYQKGSGYVNQDVPSRQVACNMFGADLGFTNARVKPGWDVPDRWGGFPYTSIACIYSSPFSSDDERSPGGAYCGPSYFQGNSFTVDKTTEKCACQPPARYMPDAGVCVWLDIVPNPPPNNPKNIGVNCPQCGEPINPVNGNMWHREVDYVAVANPDLQIVRFYNSSLLNWGSGDRHLFGKNWTSWLDMSVRPEIANAALSAKCWKRKDNGLLFCDSPPSPVGGLAIPDAVSVLRADGKRFYFNRKGIFFISDADVNESLTPIFDIYNQNVLGWSLFTANGSSELYASTGQLLSITRRTGEAISLTYSDGKTNDTRAGRWPASAPICANVYWGDAASFGRLLCATDSYGRQLNFEYNAEGVISKIIDPDGRALQYEYDGPSSNNCTADMESWWCHLNNMTTVIYQDGTSHTYYYNEASRINKGANCLGAANLASGSAHLPSAITGLVDENGGRYISWNYTCDGFSDISELSGGVEKVSIDYSNVRSGMFSPRVSRYTGVPNAQSIFSQYYGYEVINGAAKNTSIGSPCYECGIYKRSFYDPNGNLSSATDWNENNYCYVYEMGRNLETARIEGAASSSCATLFAAASLAFPMRKISTEWDPIFRLPLRVAAPKQIINYSYDNHGNMLAMSTQSTTDATGASGFTAIVSGSPRTWSYTYNDQGKVLSRNGPRTDIAEVTNYEYDLFGNLSAVVNVLGHRTEYSKYDHSGHVGRIVAPNGLVTEFTYTLRGKVSSRSVSDGTQVDTTEYTYDPAGQLIKEARPDGAWTAFGYDPAHRLVSVSDSLGNSINYTLDLTGSRTAEQVKDLAGELARQVTRVFDSLGQISRVTGAAQ